MLAAYRHDIRLAAADDLAADDRLLILSRSKQWSIAEATGLTSTLDPVLIADGVTTRITVAHGSSLIDLSH